MPARVLAILTATATLLLTPSSGITATFQWDSDPHVFDAQGGSGNWLGSNTWWTGIRGNSTWVSGSAASFGPSAGTVTVNGAVTANSLSFSTGGYTISGSSTLTLSGADTITVSNSADTATISAPIGGTAGFTKTGAGTLSFTGDVQNTYSGTATVADGTLNLSRGGLEAITGSLVIGDGSGASSSAVVTEGYMSNQLIGNPVRVNSDGYWNLCCGVGSVRETIGALAINDGRIATGNEGITVGNITSAGVATGTISGIMFLGYSTVNVSSATLSISAAIESAAASITKTGAGTLQLSGVNIYDGGTNINGGTLDLGSGDALGTQGTISFGGGTLRYSAINAKDYSARFSNAANQAYSIDTPGRIVTLASALTSSGGSLTKLGLGTLTLSGSNTYSAGTFLYNGTLLVTNNTGSGTGSGAVTVNSDATLGGTGTIAGAVNNSGSVAPGASAGTLHLGGNYTQTATGTLNIELASASAYDVLAIAGSASLAGTLSVSIVNGFVPAEGNSFDILDWGSISGTFSSLQLPALSGSLEWNTSQLYTSGVLSVVLAGDFNGNGVVDAADYVTWRKGLGTTYTQSDYDLWRTHFGQSAGSGTGAIANSAVPEPATLLLLMSAAAGSCLRRVRAA